MPQIRFHFAGQVTLVQAEKGQKILKIALDNGIPMEHACGGNGFCTTCMCTVQEGMEHLSHRNDREENMGITSDPWRLGCQTSVVGDGDIVIEVGE
ncbi:ISC system 2Fe-2S type ferredoxin [Candidatus Peregrinibacteria bacterium CG10_big_fil_rev_8_21_14_0_10_49_16]|nr:MAG: ISC system 2Fe-2S type ferredoxin [Candidatus Peregrinibacteria bacterium CG10_big_fil_rev_8_21_14_0_10_49_16]